MSKPTAKGKNATSDHKLLLTIGITGCLCMALAAALESFEIEGAIVLMIAYQITIPVLCTTLGTPRNELYAVNPHARYYDKLALILHQIQLFTWVFNIFDYYISGEEIWSISLCVTILSNSIYTLFISDPRKDRLATMGATLSGIAAVNGMIFDDIELPELFWISSLSFFLLFILPAIGHRFQKRPTISASDVKFPE